MGIQRYLPGQDTGITGGGEGGAGEQQQNGQENADAQIDRHNSPPWSNGFRRDDSYTSAHFFGKRKTKRFYYRHIIHMVYVSGV
ncbi:MAG: hypothetical protein Kow0096_22840 [Thiohalomonadaceae bacterium]